MQSEKLVQKHLGFPKTRMITNQPILNKYHAIVKCSKTRD